MALAPQDEMVKHMQGLARLDQDFPQLVGLAFALAQRLTNYVNTHRIHPKDIKFQDIKWHNDGMVTFKVMKRVGKNAWIKCAPMDVILGGTKPGG